ncbi:MULTISPECIES: substrate-binding domain-containing protein [unclassified Marinobacter]|uniref:substrate-binding domain-containing protein n=1 Tax=unclassified Marinobacter TaxID=83889 RepID=UPI0026E450DD|nr:MULTISPECIES: substrate-binding domain-containing protein [unclassified Marinobacter]MDO6442832.1 substrate-binding domain-containing protein [Marinobacter sp. 2_MG-2023]MDO6822951.1 substrate-binding domain-containing protein [Marinobacter sp. 1_MG-2023]
MFIALFSLTQPLLSAPKVIVNDDAGITSLDSSHLSQIFAMQIRKWPNGLAIEVFTLPSENELHREFVINRLHIQTHQLDRIWNRMLFTGTGKAPAVVNSQAEMVEMIRSTPGAIGYTSADYPTGSIVTLGDKE